MQTSAETGDHEIPNAISEDTAPAARMAAIANETHSARLPLMAVPKYPPAIAKKTP